MIKDYKIEKLDNGINLIMVPDKSVDTINTIVYFPVGSRYEEKEYNGISHFIEHIMFKGTEKRPNTLILSTELDSMGAVYNAYTSKDMTAYYIKSSKDYTEKNIIDWLNAIKAAPSPESIHLLVEKITATKDDDVIVKLVEKDGIDQVSVKS